MNIKSILWTVTRAFIPCACYLAVFQESVFGQAAKEPTELQNLRQSWVLARKQAVVPLDEKYRNALIEMKLRFTKEGKLDEAIAVDREIKSLSPNVPSTPLGSEAKPPRDIGAELVGKTLSLTFDKGSDPSGPGPIILTFGPGGTVKLSVSGQEHPRSFKIDDKGSIIVDPTTNGTRSWTLEPEESLDRGTVESSSGAKGRFRASR